ncbi:MULTISPECIES: Txe/YoeB family addiction module toxin [unclassified Microcoleus]|uniref:Txe/YoeB family addiction module toxin n=1 Tax=unclassified Microcoleus TaxID=2642155 RepID=UPI002FD31CA2
MTRKLAWTDDAWGDYLYWQGQDKKKFKRINKLIEATIRFPFEGIGKPEPLRENLAGASHICKNTSPGSFLLPLASKLQFLAWLQK